MTHHVSIWLRAVPLSLQGQTRWVYDLHIRRTHYTHTTHTHTHAFIHIHTHTHTLHTLVHMHAHTHSYTPHTRTHTHAFIHTHTRICTLTHTYSYTHTHTHKLFALILVSWRSLSSVHVHSNCSVLFATSILWIQPIHHPTLALEK